MNTRIYILLFIVATYLSIDKLCEFFIPIPNTKTIATSNATSDDEAKIAANFANSNNRKPASVEESPTPEPSQSPQAEEDLDDKYTYDTITVMVIDETRELRPILHQKDQDVPQTLQVLQNSSYHVEFNSRDATLVQDRMNADLNKLVQQYRQAQTPITLEKLKYLQIQALDDFSKDFEIVLSYGSKNPDLSGSDLLDNMDGIVKAQEAEVEKHVDNTIKEADAKNPNDVNPDGR